MATQLSVPAPVYIPQGEVLAPEPESIQNYHFELTEAARNFRRCVAQIAYYGFRMRMSDGWTAFGFESGPRGEEAYRESLGIPRSTYYKHVRIGQMLHQLPLIHINVDAIYFLVLYQQLLVYLIVWLENRKQRTLLQTKEQASL